MIPADKMPDDSAELADIDIEFPQLQPNGAASCPVALDDVLQYLRAESPDAESVNASKLEFLRTAQVADHRYWIWAFRESNGSDCFVTVAQSPDRTTCTGYEENYYGLTPEQFMLGDYHQVF